MLSASDAITIGNAILSKVQELSIPNIHKAVAVGGMDAGQLAAEYDRSKLMRGVYKLFSELPYEAKLRAIPILAEQVLKESKGHGEPSGGLIRLLQQHGFQYVNGAVLPTGFFDEREAQHLPASAADELARAMDRLSRDVPRTMWSAKRAQYYAALGLPLEADVYIAKLNEALHRITTEAERVSDSGRAPDARPRAHLHRDSTQASGRLGDRISEGEERYRHRPTWWKGEELLG